MDLVLAAVQRLQQSSQVSVDIYNRRPPHKIEGTGALFAVVLDGGPWGTPTRGQTRWKRVLRVNLYSDCTRDDDGFPTNDDAATRAWAAWDGIDRTMNVLDGSWMAVCTSLRSEEPEEVEVPGGDYSVLLSGRFEVSA